MAAIRYSPRARSDLQRLAHFLAHNGPGAAVEAVDLIVSAVEALERHPLLGRPVESDYRELVISRGKSGYLALYRYEEQGDRVLILAIRHQREAGFA